MKKIYKILYILSIVLPLIDTYKGIKKAIINASNDQFFKEQEEIYRNIKSQL